MTDPLGRADLPAAVPTPTSSAPSLLVDLPPRADDDSSLVHDLLRHTPIPTIVLDPSLVVRQLSDSYVDVSGASGQQLLGCHIDDFLAKVSLPSAASASQAIRAAQESAAPCQLEDWQDETTVWNVRTVPIIRHGNLRCIQMELEDVTEARRMQLELEERRVSNETFRILVETVKDYAIFMLDPDGNVATWNAGAEAFKGYTKDQIIGKHFSNFYSQEDRDNDKPGRELRDALRDGRVEDEGWRYRSDGSRFWANVVITPVYRDDVLIGFSKVTRDLSERKKAETSLIEAYEEASKLKSEFLANMSHEIRTPMHGMLSALTLLLDTQLNSEQLDLARVIQESGDILLQLINDILDYSKFASGSFSISHDIISVIDIIQSVVRAQENCCKPEVRLESHLDTKLPESAEGDSLRYRQIVQNLLSNATKFTEDGYVQIHARLLEETSDSFVILTEVIDTGIGIPPGKSDALFTPFTQFDNSATKRYKGTGLGLSICKSLAELMDGNIGFRPNPDGCGSIFWFTARLRKVRHIKRIKTSQDLIESSTTISSASTDSHASLFSEIRQVAVDKRILLAEDNPINQKVMVKMLAGIGFDEVDPAMNGREAVMLATKDPPPYDVILMDINMPVLDGVSATKQIRDAGVNVPIVAMTANALKGQAESYIARGMNAYISKPVDRRLLMKILLNCLQGEEAS